MVQSAACRACTDHSQTAIVIALGPELGQLLAQAQVDPHAGILLLECGERRADPATAEAQCGGQPDGAAERLLPFTQVRFECREAFEQLLRMAVYIASPSRVSTRRRVVRSNRRWPSRASSARRGAGDDRGHHAERRCRTRQAAAVAHVQHQLEVRAFHSFKIGKESIGGLLLDPLASRNAQLPRAGRLHPFDIERDGVCIHGRVGGQGAPLLLLHGHPQTHAIWHRVAPTLARQFTLVMVDLRGYGDSGRPPTDTEHRPYSKREMAQDALAAMGHHGFERLGALAHDRGARVAHRLAADHPSSVERMMLLDIAPTLAMYERTDLAFARAYWHWFFLDPAVTAARSVDRVRLPCAMWRSTMGGRYAGLGSPSPEAMAEYERCIALPGSARGICEDYRASAGIDLVHDREDTGGGPTARTAAARAVGCPRCRRPLLRRGAVARAGHAGERRAAALRPLHP